MIDFLLYFAVAFVVFFAIDIVWLSLVARKVYKKFLGYIMADKVRFIPAIIFYVIFIVGLVYFVLMPSNVWWMALLNGALFGFMAYATYDLTNLSTLKGWPLEITFIDLAWGTGLGALVSVITFLIVG
ncbi:MAG: DUF2177 family protein [Methanomicrobia archaeon]|nr:DUF2177 family protein [Methanomicrobia archaeon]